ncbi:hypothetical protein BHC51_07235 [Snodgrassella alvi]|nr:hypothetical protein BHC51_07235 [Snodgrassella alvi]
MKQNQPTSLYTAKQHRPQQRIYSASKTVNQIMTSHPANHKIFHQIHPDSQVPATGTRAFT